MERISKKFFKIPSYKSKKFSQLISEGVKKQPFSLPTYEVLEPLGIEYRTKRTGKSRLIKFLRRDGDDANDAGIAI